MIKIIMIYINWRGCATGEGMSIGERTRITGFEFKLLVLVFFIFISCIFLLMLSPKVQATDVEGHIDTDTVWKLSESPYIIRGNTYLDQNSNLTIEPGVEILFYRDYSFYINGDMFANGSQTNTIKFRSYNSFISDDWQIRINYLGNVILKHCEISYAQTAIYIGSPRNHIENTTFDSCDIAMSLNQCHNNTIKNVTISNCDAGITFFQSSSNNFSDVHFNNIRYEAIAPDTSSVQNKNHYNNSFIDCFINDRPIEYLFEIENTSIENKEAGMIVVAWGLNVTITNCNIKNGGGIYLIHTQNSMISRCNSSYNYNGIYLFYSKKTDHDEKWTGNLIENNIFSHNLYGLQLKKANENLIINNTVMSNNIGIYFRSAVTNKIYHNNFINNNLSIDRFPRYYHSTNIWNTSSEGNYWSNFNSDDLGGDGICDSKFYISYDNDDHFPLANPYNGSIPPDTTDPFFVIDPYMINYDIILPEDSIPIMFQTNEPGHYEIIIDTDRNDEYDVLSDVAIINDTEDTYNRIFWHGLDPQGNNVEDGEYHIQIMFWDPSWNPMEEPYALGPVSIATDSDDDGVLDVNDAFPHDPRESSDLDGDGIGDNSDLDLDGDGVNNHEDEYPLDKSEWKDSDGDGLGDNEDLDDNGNNIDDIVEVPLSVMILMMPIILIYLVNRSLSRRKKKSEDEKTTENEKS
jgi:parallel beta-helix repeat protein